MSEATIPMSPRWDARSVRFMGDAQCSASCSSLDCPLARLMS